MGPIKISIKTTQLEGSSEYGGCVPEKSSPEKSSTNVQNLSSEDKENETKDSSEKDIDLEKSNSNNVNKSESKATEAGTIDPSCYKYEGEECFYTEPASGVTYRWDTEKSQWVNKETGEVQEASADPEKMEKEQQNYKMEGGTYVYVDKLTNQKHKWNLETNEWDKVDNDAASDDESEEDENATEEERKARQYRKRKAAPGWDKSNYSKDPVTGVTTYTDASDGVVYELDEVKNAWFPKIDEDFMAIYQLNYGFTADGKAEPTKPSEEVAKPVPEPVVKKTKGTVVDEPAKWFDVEEAKTTKVYVSNLPTSITEESFVELMSKCGMVEFDVRTKKPKVKIYRDADNVPKGDGLCSYIKPESVQLALTILDGSELEGQEISVQRAKFEMKGDYDPKLKPKKLTKKQIEKAKKQKEKLFAWVPEKMKGERAKYEKVVVIKNMFDVEDLDADPGLILDYSSRIRAQSEKFGSVTKVCLYDKHPEGVCQVFFKDPSEADMAVQMLHGRLFGKKVMSVETWDGKSKYKMEESKTEESERLQQWEKFLREENNDGKEEGNKGEHGPGEDSTEAEGESEAVEEFQNMEET
eukprot:GFUD01020002.1.p1 GENE.GFUD01020002.1~~GFUD01020002.1.p1  ORF type:complete len:583 (-),score=207.57 GFUD01020002.1:2-1750(-)